MLSAFFFMLSALFYIRYAQGRGLACYGLSLTAFSLALFSRPTTVSLPIVLVIIDYYPLDRFKAGFFKKAVVEAGDVERGSASFIEAASLCLPQAEAQMKLLGSREGLKP